MGAIELFLTLIGAAATAVFRPQISATHPPGGGPFSFFAANFYPIEGGSPGGSADEQLFTRQNFPCPAIGNLNQPSSIATGVAYFHTSHFDIPAYFFAPKFRPRTHREGDHFHFSQQIFILSRGARPAGQRMNNFLPGKTSHAPQSATSISPVV